MQNNHRIVNTIFNQSPTSSCVNSTNLLKQLQCVRKTHKDFCFSYDACTHAAAWGKAFENNFNENVRVLCCRARSCGGGGRRRGARPARCSASPARRSRSTHKFTKPIEQRQT
ncbi:hypothetical protein EVAR_56971_1 [Eumeta japonica]|uniref:Uncharacterized protein n=1 Tax=Eumeta variegata TaxID=151549 RepID=A0A4C1ZCD8_EUMVA|nr:hypothetical protein EVAR_56971_1 [Eumeta japonica]